eukprot:TRINITY_DN1414_c1_g7_i1.p1 TRINITY_DN1414_c1_g7~~TRINITY_DN1414_c1_g7_i1.p1  ORF type:complete len:236 (+),score=30.80 TRINITY_DN1414_c1_g7_i1:59-709(+)
MEEVEKKTPLQNKWTFWYLLRDSPKIDPPESTYPQMIKKLGSFDTVESFWQYYQHISRDTSLKRDIHLFKNAQKPLFETFPEGGRLTFRITKALSFRYFEQMLMASVGEIFDVGNEVCGIVLSSRFKEDVLSVWVKNSDNFDAVKKIKEKLLTLFGIPELDLEFQEHRDSDKAKIDLDKYESDRLELEGDRDWAKLRSGMANTGEDWTTVRAKRKY